MRRLKEEKNAAAPTCSWPYCPRMQNRDSSLTLRTAMQHLEINNSTIISK
jgi:hypothetical protein